MQIFKAGGSFNFVTHVGEIPRPSRDAGADAVRGGLDMNNGGVRGARKAREFFAKHPFYQKVYMLDTAAFTFTQLSSCFPFIVDLNDTALWGHRYFRDIKKTIVP